MLRTAIVLKGLLNRSISYRNISGYNFNVNKVKLLIIHTSLIFRCRLPQLRIEISGHFQRKVRIHRPFGSSDLGTIEKAAEEEPENPRKQAALYRVKLQ